MHEAATPQDTAALIDLIVARYHDAHRNDLADLEPLARKVESVHRDDAEAPKGLADALAALAAALEARMDAEEAALFPALRAGAAEGLVAIAAFRAGHDDLSPAAALVRARTGALPDHACRSWRRLHAGAAKLLDDLAAHAALENDVLFPRFAPAA